MSNRFKTIPLNKTVHIVQQHLLTPHGPTVKHVFCKPKALKKNRQRKPLTLEDSNTAHPRSQSLKDKADPPPDHEESAAWPEQDWAWEEDQNILMTSRKTKVQFGLCALLLD